MNEAIANRFRLASESWDFSTVINGKVVKAQDLEAFRQESVRLIEERESRDKIKEEQEKVIVSPEDITKELQREYQVVAPEPVVENNDGERLFRSLEDFNLWYLSHREEFAVHQREFLNLLVQVELLVNQGCECKKEERRGQAYAFYQRLLVTNKETDIIAAIKTIGKFSLVRFTSPGDETPFLEA